MEKLRIRKFLTDKKLNGHKIYIDTFNNSVKCYDLEKLILEYVNKNTPKCTSVALAHNGLSVGAVH